MSLITDEERKFYEDVSREKELAERRIADEIAFTEKYSRRERDEIAFVEKYKDYENKIVNDISENDTSTIRNIFETMLSYEVKIPLFLYKKNDKLIFLKNIIRIGYGVITKLGINSIKLIGIGTLKLIGKYEDLNAFILETFINSMILIGYSIEQIARWIISVNFTNNNFLLILKILIKILITLSYPLRSIAFNIYKFFFEPRNKYYKDVVDAYEINRINPNNESRSSLEHLILSHVYNDNLSKIYRNGEIEKAEYITLRIKDAYNNLINNTTRFRELLAPTTIDNTDEPLDFKNISPENDDNDKEIIRLLTQDFSLHKELLTPKMYKEYEKYTLGFIKPFDFVKAIRRIYLEDQKTRVEDEKTRVEVQKEVIKNEKLIKEGIKYSDRLLEFEKILEDRYEIYDRNNYPKYEILYKRLRDLISYINDNNTSLLSRKDPLSAQLLENVENLRYLYKRVDDDDDVNFGEDD